jgi:hypothetical protein
MTRSSQGEIDVAALTLNAVRHRVHATGLAWLGELGLPAARALDGIVARCRRGRDARGRSLAPGELTPRAERRSRLLSLATLEGDVA